MPLIPVSVTKSSFVFIVLYVLCLIVVSQASTITLTGAVMCHRVSSSKAFSRVWKWRRGITRTTNCSCTNQEPLTLIMLGQNIGYLFMIYELINWSLERIFVIATHGGLDEMADMFGCIFLVKSYTFFLSLSLKFVTVHLTIRHHWVSPCDNSLVPASNKPNQWWPTIYSVSL